MIETAEAAEAGFPGITPLWVQQSRSTYGWVRATTSSVPSAARREPGRRLTLRE
jgi:hypothetical protein